MISGDKGGWPYLSLNRNSKALEAVYLSLANDCDTVSEGGRGEFSFGK